MKVIALVGTGGNQKALVNRINQKFDLVGIVLEEKKTKRTISSILNGILDRVFFPVIRKTWFELMQYYEMKWTDYPNTSLLKLSNINTEKTIKFVNNLKPDLIIVSGTRIIRNDILRHLNTNKGMLNLHTGLSPYLRGGPNCTNWCISENNFKLIGNTIMFIDAGIDTGNILLTEVTELKDVDSYFLIHKKVMEHAHNMYIRVIVELAKKEVSIKSINQKNIAEGKLYTDKMWNFKAKSNLVKNIKKPNRKRIIMQPKLISFD